MKKILPALFLGILFLSFQSTLLTTSLFYRVRPDLVLIFTIYLGLSRPILSGSLIAFFLGYGIDVFSGHLFGLFAFSRPFLFYLAQFFKNHLYLENTLFQGLLVFILSWLEGLLIILLLRILNPEPWNLLRALLFPVFLPQSLTTAIIAPFIFSLLHKVSFSLLSDPKIRKRKKKSYDGT